MTTVKDKKRQLNLFLLMQKLIYLGLTPVTVHGPRVFDSPKWISIFEEDSSDHIVCESISKQYSMKFTYKIICQ